MAKGFAYFLVLAAAAAVLGYFTLPVNRVNMRSRLVMLGDFNSDNMWDSRDAALLAAFVADPFAGPADTAYKADVNHNGLLDAEDIAFLEALYAAGDPYKARAKSEAGGRAFPYPREFFRYVPDTEYIQRPVIAIKHPAEDASPLTFLKQVRLAGKGGYQGALLHEIYSEGIRFTLAYAKRAPWLDPREKVYGDAKLRRCAALWAAGRHYELLLDITGLTEDAETLTVKGQPPFVAQSLYFRDHLRALLESPLYKNYTAGKAPAEEVLKAIEKYALEDMKLTVDLVNMEAPRNFLELKNYADRVRWQYYKTTSTRRDFRRLLLFAQYDRRYLRAAARTTKKLADAPLENHNLPMVLLFREALAIKDGNKLAAVGLVDEAVRIPFAWIKSIPRNKLPASVALENFLLPGNKEDGSDKSRHWNVFGGISLYKSPEASLQLALAREVNDFREEGRTPKAMTEFIRDTMANLNGIYYVVSINPALLK
ncbi:MAG: hypothetical protein A2081_03090 [Elusimicrobia bacterium GWC2_61_19]|nr:MAG: hypothetical protein A2081_03090 [Elusimicrobia bacterium GWC2_61_19]